MLAICYRRNNVLALEVGAACGDAISDSHNIVSEYLCVQVFTKFKAVRNTHVQGSRNHEMHRFKLFPRAVT